jgi:hypothetical protein
VRLPDQISGKPEPLSTGATDFFLDKCSRTPWRSVSSASNRLPEKGVDADALSGAVIDGHEHTDRAFLGGDGGGHVAPPVLVRAVGVSLWAVVMSDTRR